MSILLGTLALDEAATAVREQYEELGGRDGRTMVLTGLLSGASDIEARLDAILAAASDDDYSCALSLRPGRRLWVRRLAFTREAVRGGGAGSFELKLEAKEPFEESIEERTLSWSIAAQGSTVAVEPLGNAPSQPVVTLVAGGVLVNPSVGDGVRTIAYDGAVGAGHTLVFDSVSERALLNGEDVTAYASGEFPRVDAGGGALVYADDASSAHTASATVTFRDRWW